MKQFNNIILNTDSYKLSHWKQYPPGTKHVSSYIESRGFTDPFRNEPEVVHFGLQMFLDELAVPITQDDIDYAKPLIEAHGFEFNEPGWNHILNKHGGYLPVQIQALPEGTVIKSHIPQVQIYNTDPNVPWLTSYLETSLLRATWYPSTVATLSREAKKMIWKYLVMTCDDPASQIMFKLHDFGARGATSDESAAIGGCAHLVNFMGTDTIGGLIAAREYYDCAMAGFSIPAAEHSTITSWGDKNEEQAYANMLKQFASKGKLLAVVSDSYDIYNAVEHIWGENLREQVINSGATVVIRPDSGDPVTVVSRIIDSLGEKFGYTINQKGYKVLHPAVRVIQGDGINLLSIELLLAGLLARGWSVENLAFGMGGALLQGINRDTLKYAMKQNAIKFDGDWIDVYKKPKSDMGKASKAGRQMVVRTLTTNPDKLGWLSVKEHVTVTHNYLEPVFENGEVLKFWNFDTVRENAKI